MSLHVVILAAGKGTRMRSSLPKVLHPVAGRPMVSHVIATAQQLGAEAIHLVYGHGGELLQQRLTDAQVTWVLQAEQLGTGHAVAQATPAIPDDAQVLVLYGDTPLITAATLEPRVSAIVVVQNAKPGPGRASPLDLCLRGALAEPSVEELIIVDLGKEPEVSSALRAFQADRRDVKLVTAPNSLSFAAGLNLGARHARVSRQRRPHL